MSIMLFVIILHLLVARAINTRVESPPRLVLLTSRRYYNSRSHNQHEFPHARATCCGLWVVGLVVAWRPFGG